MSSTWSGRYVQLKKGGANFMGLCPFHGEKSPSFSVSPAKQFYHCFGCGKNGNAISFLMEHTGMGFIEAVNDLAGQVGMVVPQEDISPKSASARPRPSSSKPHSTMCWSVPALLIARNSEAAPHAVQYLKDRGVSGAISSKYGLGYAPAGWRNLASVFPEYDDPQLHESGLVIVGEDEASATTAFVTASCSRSAMSKACASALAAASWVTKNPNT